MSYIELYDPEQGDEQEVEGDEEAEGPPHVRDALLLAGIVRLHPRTDGLGVDWHHPSARQPRIGAATASAVHHPGHAHRAGPAPPTGQQKVDSQVETEEAGHRSRKSDLFV